MLTCLEMYSDLMSEYVVSGFVKGGVIEEKKEEKKAEHGNKRATASRQIRSTQRGKTIARRLHFANIIEYLIN